MDEKPISYDSESAHDRWRCNCPIRYGSFQSTPLAYTVLIVCYIVIAVFATSGYVVKKAFDEKRQFNRTFGTSASDGKGDHNALAVVDFFEVH